MNKRFWGLDGLRGICAVVILLYHLMPLLGIANLIPHGYIAVDTFFMISGFVIAASYEQRLRNGLTVVAFMRARIKRLGPVYWLGMTMGTLSMLTIAIGIHRVPAATALPTILLLLVAESLLIPVMSGTVNGFILNSPSWSIFSEFVVNVLYGCSIRVLSPRALVALVGVGWVAMSWIACTSPYGWNFGHSADTILFSVIRAIPAFALGVLMFRMRAHRWLNGLPEIPPLWPVSIWCGLAVIPNVVNQTLIDGAAVMVATPVLIALLVRSERPCPHWFQAVGALSYPLYMCQMPIIFLARCTLFVDPGAPSNFLSLAATAGVILGVAWLVGYWFEPMAQKAIDLGKLRYAS